MKRQIPFIAITVILSALTVQFTGCDDDSSTTAPSGQTHFADENWDTAELVRGGKLYDKWWAINGAAEPTGDFDPIWSSQSTNGRSGSTTWRCKECHGWDYKGDDGAYGSGSHFTGFNGVWSARDNNRTVAFDSIKGEGGAHDFSGVLSDTDVLDLTKFVLDGLVDMSQYIDYSTKASLGNAANGSSLFDNNCSVCHSADGRQIDFGGGEFVGTLSNDNPWEILHKIRFGHPGTLMPSMVEEGLTIVQQSDILAYCQTLPENPPHYAEEHWDDAELVRGGTLYDKWWVINGETEPSSNFDPIWSSQSTNGRSGSTTWRCKECHGWDYKGLDGAYGSGSHYTGFVGVWDARNNVKTEIFDAIKDENGDHDFSVVLSDDDALDLTKLVVDGLIDMSLYIDYTTKEALGNATNGQPLYDANCSLCHGLDGKQIDFGNGVYVGTLANDNPWETLHKVRFGHPGSLMPSMVEEGLTVEEQSDILTHAQTLPTQ